MSFADDVRAQPEVIRGLVRAYSGEHAAALGAAVGVVGGAGSRPVLVVGMGSSLSAGRSLVGAGSAGPLLVFEDAGELRHFGLDPVPDVAAVIAISQSGRSFETVAVVDRLRAAAPSRTPVIALVNDPASPLALAADVVLPLLAGVESPVASRTYTAAVTVLAMLRAGGVTPALAADLDTTAAAMADLAELDAAVLVDHFDGARAFVLVGRGPGLAAAHYGALTTKESAAIPAEAMTGGAFRHGPVELLGHGVGIVVVAPGGPAADLGTALALEAAERDTRTWLLATAAATPPGAHPNLRVTTLPDVPPALASLAAIVPMQLLAAELATRAGRTPGQTLIAGKVTDRE